MVTKDSEKYYSGYRPEVRAYRVDHKPFDLSYAEWFKKWWSWMASRPKSDHPMLEKTGKSLRIQPDKNVFFLASVATTFVTTRDGFSTPDGSVSRKCIIKKDKAILIPLIYSLHDTRSGSQNTLIDDANECLAGTDLSLTVDGIPFDGRLGPPISEFKITAGPFVVKYDPQSPFISGPLRGSYGTGNGVESVIVGYLVLLAPLSAGEHTIHFIVNSKGNPKDKKKNPDFFKNVKYTIQIK